MGDYWEWQQEDGPVVRVHRRVPAGLARESGEDFRGVLLGAVSAEGGAVVVEDFAREEGGAGSHSLPVIGSFRVVPEQHPRISDSDRERFDRDFPDPLQVFLLFQSDGGNIRWADAWVQPRNAPAVVEAGEQHRVLLRHEQGDAPVEAGDQSSAPRRPYLWTAAAVCAGFLIGAGLYVAARGGSPREKVSGVVVQRPAPRAMEPIAEGKASPFEADRAVEPGKPGTPVQDQIRSVLDRWRRSLLDNDVDSYASLYAPTVAPYFNKSRVSRSEVADETRRTVLRYGPLTDYRISDVKIVPVDENHATATLRKHWQTAGDNFSGEEETQLRFERQRAKWAIVSEKELRVFWVRRK